MGLERKAGFVWAHMAPFSLSGSLGPEAEPQIRVCLEVHQLHGSTQSQETSGWTLGGKKAQIN